jgi:hypothetical protein
MFDLIVPHHQVDTVLELSAERLRALDLDALLLDVDCTLKSYRSRCFSPEVTAWLAGLRDRGIGLCLVSNGRGKRIGDLAKILGIPFLARACKPFPYACRRAVERMGFNPQRTAMVGDQLFADVVAARWAGLTSILVRPIHPEEEPWYTQLKRPLEWVFIRWILPRFPPRRRRDKG